ncbi:MAG: hypothetical protein KDC12_05595 [Flavobacteriales bacterium]|nr:hypothetical protein [Flavobacteriales bacterium]
MNLQDIVNPLGKLMESTFGILEGELPNMFNWLCIVLGFVGLFYWLRTQKRYNQRAKSEGTLA